MIRTGLRLLIAGSSVFLLALPVYMPADRVINHFRDRLPAGLVWGRVSGTVLKPDFYQPGYRRSDGRGLFIDQAQARISILPLLLGRLSLRFELQNGAYKLNGIATLTRDRWQLSHIEGGLPVRKILTLLPASGFERSDGLVTLIGNRLTGMYGSLPDGGELEVKITRFYPDLQGITHALGDYGVILQAHATGIDGSIRTLHAEAQLGIDASLGMDRTASLLRIDGHARVSDSADTVVRDMLPLFGVVENGVARMEWRIPM